MLLASLSNKRVLVTGASGFTGSHLIRTLKNLGCDTLSISMRNTLSSIDNAFVTADITDSLRLTEIIKNYRPDYIIHLAAISFVGHDNNLDFYHVNVIGTQNLLDSILASKIPPPKLLITSSANVYGALEAENITEQDNCLPVNHYAVSKLAMEKIVATYFDKLKIIIVRPFNYTGVGQAEHFLIPKIISHYKENKKTIELGNIDVSRDYSDVSFVIDAYVKLLESDFHSDIVNVCSSRLISLENIISRMNEIAGYNINVVVNPRYVRSNEIKTISGSNKKLFNIIGKLPIINFDSTLNNMFKS